MNVNKFNLKFKLKFKFAADSDSELRLGQFEVASELDSEALLVALAAQALNTGVIASSAITDALVLLEL